jgi:steroid delta-isomerase-like uncharacterized protein
MSSANKLLVRRWFEEVWNQGRTESIAKMFAADGVAHGLAPDGGALKGPEAFAGFQQAFLKAFPDLKLTVEDLIEEGDKVAVRWSTAGTLQGDGLGVIPTGRSMKVTGMTIVRLRDGMLVEGWNNFDVLGMHQQVGTLAQLC